MTGWLHRDDGTAAVTYTTVIALSMLLFVLAANVIVVLYGRGVVRGALDEGVRIGSRANVGAAVCEQRVGETLDQLMGTMREGVAYRCFDDGDAIAAAADIAWPGWLPGVPTLRFTLGARAVSEGAR